jgi:hypothetical protein
MPGSALFSGSSLCCVCCAQAKAWDSLALFFEACAQIEIDDFRDYQKALQVLLLDSLRHPLHSLRTHCWP